MHKPSQTLGVLGAYLAGGFAVGLVPMQQVAAGAGLRPGVGTAVGVNVALPLFALGLAVWRPRFTSVWAGGPLLALGFFLGAMVRAEPRFWLWTGNLALNVGHPILIGAAIGCGVVGSVVVVIRRAAFPAQADGSV
jgi:hypothetical protein